MKHDYFYCKGCRTEPGANRRYNIDWMVEQLRWRGYLGLFNQTVDDARTELRNVEQGMMSALHSIGRHATATTLDLPAFRMLHPIRLAVGWP